MINNLRTIIRIVAIRSRCIDECMKPAVNFLLLIYMMLAGKVARNERKPNY